MYAVLQSRHGLHHKYCHNAVIQNKDFEHIFILKTKWLLDKKFLNLICPRFIQRNIQEIIVEIAIVKQIKPEKLFYFRPILKA